MSESITYTFRWPYAGTQLCVGGSWNGWVAMPMHKEGPEFVLTVTGLKPNTRYLYKYVVDGNWQEDLTSPIDQGEIVNGRPVKNNVLATGSADVSARLAAAERERDVFFRTIKQLELQTEISQKKQAEIEAELLRLRSNTPSTSSADTARVAALEKELSTTNQKLAEAQTALTQSQASAASSKATQDRLAETESQLIVLRAAHEKSSKDHQAALLDTATAQKKAAEAENLQKGLTPKLEAATKRNSELEAELAKIKSQSNETGKAQEKVSAEKQAMEKELSQLKEQLKSSEASQNEAKNALAAAQKSAQAAQEEIEKAEKKEKDGLRSR